MQNKAISERNKGISDNLPAFNFGEWLNNLLFQLIFNGYFKAISSNTSKFALYCIIFV
jgi:hypothetical protein